MIRCDIKDLFLTAGEYVDVPCTPPCTLLSVFRDKGYIKDPMVGFGAKGTDVAKDSPIVFKSVLKLNKSVTSSKHVFLFLHKTNLFQYQTRKANYNNSRRFSFYMSLILYCLLNPLLTRVFVRVNKSKYVLY